MVGSMSLSNNWSNPSKAGAAEVSQMASFLEERSRSSDMQEVNAAVFIIAGFGNALYDPALNAYILDITPVSYQGQILGIKSTAGSLGSILGLALVVLFADVLSAQGVFMVATSNVFLITLAFLFAQKESHSAKIGQVNPATDIQAE